MLVTPAFLISAESECVEPRGKITLKKNIYIYTHLFKCMMLLCTARLNFK